MGCEFMANADNLKVIRAGLLQMGKTYSQVARELGVDRTIVEGVLSGRLKGVRGEAHKVAVALGLKEGVIIGDDMPIAEAMKQVAAR